MILTRLVIALLTAGLVGRTATGLIASGEKRMALSMLRDGNKAFVPAPIG
jgi:hypothetical protein